MNCKKLPPFLPFTAFVAWLLAVPMGGPLVAAAGLPSLSFYFLLPHVCSLFLIGALCQKSQIDQLTPYGAVLTACMTLLLPSFPQAIWLLAIPMGVSGAVVAIASCQRLNQSSAPVKSAAAGLICANLSLFILMVWAPHSLLAFLLISLPLCLLLWPPHSDHLPENPHRAMNDIQELWLFLPFLFLFHLVGGLMYSALYPAYLEVSFISGMEVFFYIATIIWCIFLLQYNREVTLLLGILLAILAFVLLQLNMPLTTNLSMFSVQAGQGIIDLFLIAYLLSFKQVTRSFGFGLATLCMGIAGGQLLGATLPHYTERIALTGLICLNLAALSLYFYRLRDKTPPGRSDTESAAKIDKALPVSVQKPHVKVPEIVRLQLSDRELMVLEESLNGLTYRDIAEKLDISESSIKTYMKRVHDKLGTHNRKGLVEMIDHHS